MSVDGKNLQLLQGVYRGNFDAVKAALKAGANANGPSELILPPISAAAVANHVDILNLLLDQGADPDRPVTKEVPCPCPGSAIARAMLGERALHLAARGGRVEVVRLLLKRTPRADPNAFDDRGFTPLMATCKSPRANEEVVRLLLGAGADGALANNSGCIPLYAVAYYGHTNLVGPLFSRDPSTLNRCCTSNGATPLFAACMKDHVGMVSKLLSLGATQPDDNDMCPLVGSTEYGFTGVVRVLINEGGIRAVRGEEALVKALFAAVRFRQAGVLRLLLNVQGEEMRSWWANIYADEMRLLHCGTSFCYPSGVSVLLEAGADETLRDAKRRVPREVIGDAFDLTYALDKREEKEIAIRRMLQSGPAYRARSWAWPSDADASGSSDGGSTAAAAAAAVHPPLPAVKTPPVVGVPIFRSKETSGRSKFFVRLVGR